MQASAPMRLLQEQTAGLVCADSTAALMASLERQLVPLAALPARLYLLDGRAGVFYSAAGLGCPQEAPDLPVPRSVAEWPPDFHLLRAGEQIVGALKVAPGAQHGVGQIAALLGPALVARFRQEQATQETAQLSELLACLTSAGELLRHIEVDTLLTKVLETAMQAVKAQVGALLTLDGEHLRTRVTWGLRDEHVDAIRYRTGVRVPDEVLASGQAACLSADQIAGQLDLQALQAKLTGLLVLPLSTGERRQGVVLLANPERAFGAGEQRLAQTVCGMAAIAIDNALLVRQTLDRERLKKEMDLARAVQASMFPTGTLGDGAWRIAGAARPCSETGGDYYSYVPRDGRLLAMIGDVSGHGLGAALYTTTAHAIVHQQLRAKADLEPCFLTLNESLLNAQSGRFMTAAVVEIDPADGAFTYVSAGHNPLLWIHAGEARWLESSGLPLGIMADADFPPISGNVLAPGDYLVLYTDGLTEAAGPGEEMFGEERLASAALAAAARGLDAEAMVAAIWEALDGFTRGVPYADDLTLVVVAGPPSP